VQLLSLLASQRPAPSVLLFTSHLVHHGHPYIEALLPIEGAVRWTALLASISTQLPALFPPGSPTICHSSARAVALQRLILLYRQPLQTHSRCKPAAGPRLRYSLVSSSQSFLPNLDLPPQPAKHRCHVRTCRLPRLPFPFARVCMLDRRLNHGCGYKLSAVGPRG
jgi:hypothetical protein